MLNNQYLNKASDLITLHSARRTGFIEYALRKNQEAIPYIDRARALRTVVARECKKPEDILRLGVVRESLLEAAGISVKAKKYLNDEDKLLFLREFVDKVLAPRGNDFIEEIIFRYLLTAGDALGGKMRNIIGGIAGEKLTRFIVSQLQIKNLSFQYCIDSKDKFFDGDEYTLESAQKIKSMRWKLDSGERRQLVYNITIPQVQKNIDIVLFANFFDKKLKKIFLQDRTRFICAGELKGGIDPAGADEHWKTANTALGRVRDAFGGTGLHLIFIGAAIESAMASEIFEQYQNGDLANCANLTSEGQLSALCDWLTSL